MVLNLYSKGAHEIQHDLHVWGKSPGYFHRYLDRSFEKIIITMNKQMLYQSILRTSLESIILLYLYCYIWATQVAQMVKNPLAMEETQVWSLGQEDPLEKGMATHSSFFCLENSMDTGAWNNIRQGNPAVIYSFKDWSGIYTKWRTDFTLEQLLTCHYMICCQVNNGH